MKFPLSLAFALLAGTLLAGANAFAAPPAKAPPLPADSVYQLPLKLTDQHGKTWDWRSRRGHPQLVAMFYSSCQYICPLIVESGKAVDRSLTPAQRARLGVLFISMDPARDTPAALMKVVRDRRIEDKRWALASPEPDAVRSVAGVLDIRYRQLADGEFNHTSALILLDADGRILARTEKMGSKVDPDFLAAVRKAL
ncbi:SCO family protein [Cognatiluteimonas weifangensis]|uniref:SCO family protein n=1 Tax=Cognatiluteimonas weifangensis TaxID=2303539 RepID=A0A372DNL7_9GAMM|nr:SCO family protein [Luteimonas weifangensis]RFP61126.1 SCO family protein [Luteimonas weifangensis]